VILAACALWIAFMGFMNVRSRREEIGILRTVGVSAKSIFLLFIWKHISVGILGGCLGLVFGSLSVLVFANPGVAIRDVGAPLFWLEWPLWPFRELHCWLCWQAGFLP